MVTKRPNYLKKTKNPQMKVLIKPYTPPSFSFLNFGLIAFWVYCVAVYQYSSNFPYLDDFDAVLRFLNDRSATSGVHFYLKLFDQHNEHRVFITHFFSVLTLQVFGSIYFPLLIFLGNLGWMLTILLIWQYAKKYSITLVEFSPVLLVLLSFSHWGMMTWAMTAIQQYWQILFCLLAIYALTQDRFIFSGIYCALAIFTGGGSLVLAPLFCLYFIVQRSWRCLFIFAIFFGFLLFIYFSALPYIPPGTGKLLNVLSHPLRFGAFFFGFLGGAFNLSELGPASFIVAGISLAGVLLIKAKKFLKKNDFLTWVIIFILMCSFVGALNRSDAGFESGGASHYSIYSLLLISSLYLKMLVATPSQDKRGDLTFCGMLLAVLLFSYWAWKAPAYLEDRRHILQNGYIIYPDKASAKEILHKSEALGIFKSNKRFE